ncbi:MAG: pyridoxal phosphate-dependent decarboxylase family protein [Gaiellaceae bacterium]
MTDERELLRRTAEIAADFLDTLDKRPVRPEASVEEMRHALGGPLQVQPRDPRRVIDELSRAAEPGLAAMGSGRYFGFVIGGAVPAALAADMLTCAWDQNAALALPTPAAAVVEEVVGAWLADLLGIPEDATFALVTGCQMAHATCLATARNHVLAQVGHDVERHGLVGAPTIRVVAGAKRHGTLDRALRLLGIGTAALQEVPVDDQGRMLTHALLEELRAGSDGPTIVCVQAGEVNTGAFDDLEAAADATRDAGGWLHVDGAFGLWAAASPTLRHLTAGAERANSWATDAHKWLNVPFDCGVAFCAHPEPHRAAMGIRSVYLVHAEPGAGRDPVDWNPEHSRRARGFAVYAALRSLGRDGVAELIDRCCAHARRFAAELGELPGCEVLNDVVLNQVLLRFEDDETTDAVVAAVQQSGEAWLGGTVWDGRRAIRISVCNWRTSDDDVTRTVGAFKRAIAVVR